MSSVAFTWTSAHGALYTQLLNAADASGITEVESSSGTNATTTASCPYTLGGPCHVTNSGTDAVHVSFGTAPNAGTDALAFYMPPNSTLDVWCKYGHKGACINT